MINHIVYGINPEKNEVTDNQFDHEDWMEGESALDGCRKIRHDDLIGQEYTSQGDTYRIVQAAAKIELSLSSFTWCGSIGAMHYYVRIRARNCQDLDLKTNERLLVMCREKPRTLEDMSMEAQRRLLKVEKDMSGEIIGEINDFTSRFNSPEEALDSAISTILDSFEGDWVISCNDLEERVPSKYSLAELEKNRETIINNIYRG